MFKQIKFINFILLWFVSINYLQATSYTVNDKAGFEATTPTLVAGDTLVLLDGTYHDWGSLRIADLQGTMTNPIVIKSESLYGATFTGDLWLRFVEANYLIIEGLRFTQITDAFSGIITLQACNNTNIRRCSFINIGSTSVATQYNKSILLNVGSTIDSDSPKKNANNIVEYCLFQNTPACTGITLSMPDIENVVGENIFRNNVFRDTPKVLVNGGEAIQLIVGTPQNNRIGNNTIEGNVFDVWNGDPEIISVKSGKNTIKNNVFVHCTESFVSLRREKANIVEQNYFYNTRTGVWVYSEENIVRNNIFIDMIDEAIRLNAGSDNASDFPYFEVSQNNLIANNTIINSKKFGITFVYSAGNYDGIRANNNRIINNVFNIESTDVNRSFFRSFPSNAGGEENNNTIENNLYFSNTVTAPSLTNGNINQDPQVNSDLFRTFASTSPIVGVGQNLSEVTTDFFEKSRTGNHIGHTNHPLDTTNYQMPFMFFPPDVTGYASLPIEASFECFSRDWQTGSVVMLDARTSKGSYAKYRWVITSSQGTINSGLIEETVYSFIFDETLEYDVQLELLASDETVLNTIVKTVKVPDNGGGDNGNIEKIVSSNLLSPNGDGRNDTWAIENLSGDYQIRVFTKNGQIVFETDNYNQDWTGTDQNGNQLPAGVYYYSIVVSGEKKAKTGYIMIVY